MSKNMNVQIRIGVFETNSSSVHTLTICTDDEYMKWKNGELVLFGDIYSTPKIMTLEEAKKCEWFNKRDVRTYEEWKNWYDFEIEQYEREYTTPKGEKLHIFGVYGHD